MNSGNQNLPRTTSPFPVPFPPRQPLHFAQMHSIGGISCADSEGEANAPENVASSSSAALPSTPIAQPTLTRADARQIAAAMGIEPAELMRLLSSAD